jgi:hypothetical protein
MKNVLLALLLLATIVCSQAAPILVEEAKDHIGENASVRGLVEQVSFSKKGHAFLNFGGRYPQQVFTGFIPAQNVVVVGGPEFLESLSGNTHHRSRDTQLVGLSEMAISLRRAKRSRLRCARPLA